ETLVDRFAHLRGAGGGDRAGALLDRRQPWGSTPCPGTCAMNTASASRCEALLSSQVEEVRTGHCDMLPESLIEPMARAQIARDVVMADAMLDALPERGGAARRQCDAVHQFPAVEREDPCAAFARRPADRRSVRQRAQPHPQRLQPLLVTAPAIHVAGVDRLGALVVAVGRRRAAVPGHVADALLRRQVAERQHLGHDLLRVLDQLLVAHIEDPLWIQ